MRTRLLTLALLLWATTAQAAITCPNITDSAANDFSDNNASITIPATTIGNTLIVIFDFNNEGRTISSISGGATFAVYESSAAVAGANARIYAGVATSSVTTLTVTLSGNSSGIGEHLTVLECAGMPAAVAETGASTTASTTAATTHAAADVTPGVSEVILVCSINTVTNSGGLTLDADFTALFTATATKARGYRIQSNTTAQNCSNTTVNSVNATVILAAFEGTVTAGGTPKLTLLGVGDGPQ